MCNRKFKKDTDGWIVWLTEIGKYFYSYIVFYFD
jgi:hypothetical protein